MKDWQKYATDINTNKKITGNQPETFSKNQLKIIRKASLITTIITLVATAIFCIILSVTENKIYIDDFFYYLLMIGFFVYLTTLIVFLFKDGKSNNAIALIAILAIPGFFLLIAFLMGWRLFKDIPSYIQIPTIIFSVILGVSLYLLYYSQKKLKK